MSYSLNIATILGNLARDPEQRSFAASGDKVVSMTVATSRQWKGKDGEQKEAVVFHRVSIFNEKLGQLAITKLRKGSLCYVSGSISNRKYTDKDGAEKLSTEIVVGNYGGELIILDGKSTAESAPAPQARPELDDSLPF